MTWFSRGCSFEATHSNFRFGNYCDGSSLAMSKQMLIILLKVIPWYHKQVQQSCSGDQLWVKCEYPIRPWEVCVPLCVVNIHAFRLDFNCRWKRSTMPFAMRVMRGGSNTLTPKKLHQIVPQSWLKLCSTVCGNCWWDTKSRNPTLNKRLFHCLCCNISNRHPLWPAGKTINACWKICKAVWI